MGLYIVTGTMGGGKSYFAAQLAYDCWRDGGIVHSNMPWVQDEVEALGYWDKHVTLPSNHEKWVTTDQGPDGEDRVSSDVLIGGTEGQENLIIIDEASLQLSAMDQALTRQKNKTLFRLVVMSRQLGLDIYFISQSATNLDVYIRNVAESVIHCQNVNKIPGVGSILAKIVGDFRRSWLSPLKRAVILTKYARFNPVIGSLYKTDGEGAKMNIKRSERMRKKKKGNWTWKSLSAITGTAALAIWLGNNYRNGTFGIPGINTPLAASIPGLSPLPASTQAKTANKPVEEPLRLTMRTADNSSALDSRGNLYQMHGGPGSLRILRAQDNGSVLKLQLLGGREVALHYD